MCESCRPAEALTRRAVLAGAASLAAIPVASLVPAAPAAGSLGVPIRPREAWAGTSRPPGPLAVEAPGDVRFLLVHHTAGPNEYGPADVPAILQGIHGFHTGADKGWPDVAYNFFVDRFGGVWEGRAGSLSSPVIGDATGGSQGFAQLCCFLGTHTDVPPTAEAESAMVGLLAWLADRYAIDTAPGATASFVSRGSSLHPTGTDVTTATIAGHRDMSATACPGDAAYALVTSVFPQAVTARRATAAAAAPAQVAPAPPPPSAPPTSELPSSTTTVGSTTPATPPPTSGVAPPSTRGAAASTDRASGPPAPSEGTSLVWPAAATAAVAVAGGLVAWRRRAGRPPRDDHGPDRP